VRECLLAFSRDRQWINERHLEVCRIPAPTFLEERRAQWMAAQFRALNCDARIDKAGNVIAFPAPVTPQAPLVAVSAHLDTVLAPRNEDEIRVARDGRFEGPGVSDNGAGLAALLGLARGFASANPLGEGAAGIVLVANVGEEGEGNLSGMRYLCRQSSLAQRLQSFVVLDGPATDHITCQALGSRRFEISINGPGGHSWNDAGTPNPVHALSRMIAEMAELFGGARGRGAQRFSLNFGMIEGGGSVNAIPTLARTKVDMRSESAARIEHLSQTLQSALEAALEAENSRASSARLTARVREIGNRPTGTLPGDAPILRYLRDVDEHLGIRARLECSSTDANVPLSMGIQAVSIGAGGHGGGAHTPGEWYHPEGRELALRRILLTLCHLTAPNAV